MLKVYPESKEQGEERILSLVESVAGLVQAEKEHGERICYLIISHGAQVDHTSSIFNYLNKEFTVPYVYIPRNYFSNQSSDQRTRLLTSIGGKPYGHPTHCAISAFEIQE